MRLATWNINGLRARIDFMKLWLAERSPDIVGLQELKTPEGDFPVEEFEALGYHVAYVGQKSWNGVGILSRAPVEVTSTGLPGQDEMGSRLITARYEDVSFTTVYVPNGKAIEHADFPKKLVWLEALTQYMTDLDHENVVLCGDFNVVHKPLDTWRGEAGDGRVFCTPEERSRLQAVFDTGLTDLFREAHPDAETFSWWDYRGGAFHRKQGLRIDLILGDNNMRSRVSNIEVDRDFRKKKDGLTASDHAPVILDID